MDSPEHSRSYSRRDVEDKSDVKSDKAGDDEEWESSDKRKHRSSKSRKPSNEEDTEVLESSGRRRYADQNDSRKRSCESSKAGSDDEDYESRKELRSRQIKKKQEGSALEKLSSWYQDGELENKQDSRDRSGSRSHGRVDDTEKRKITLKISDPDNLQSRSKSKSHRRRWDEPEAVVKDKESVQVERADVKSEKASDPRHDDDKERSTSARIESSERKSRGLESNGDKGFKFNNREEKRDDTERSKGRGRSEAPEEDNKFSPLTGEDRSTKDKNENIRQQRNPSSRDGAESRERSFNTDEDGNIQLRERSGREVEHSNRSRTPERSGRRHQESENSEMDYDRISSFKRKEYEKDGCREDRQRARDDSWSDKNRDRDVFKDSWKRRQPSSNDKETKDRDTIYDHSRDWELQRHGRERADGERHQGRSSGRKDGRTEAVKTSSNYGISNENYDVIEIQTKPLDYRGEEFGSSFARRSEIGQQSDVKSAPDGEERSYLHDERAKRSDIYGSGTSGDDSKEKYMDDGPMRDQGSWKDDNGFQGGNNRGHKGAISGHAGGGQSTSGSQPLYGNQDQGSFNRSMPQGAKGSRVGRGGRVRPGGRDGQQVGMPLPMMGSPFGPLGMPPPGPMQPLNPTMSPSPGPPITPGVFLPPFSPPIVWPGARGADMNMLAVPPGLSPVPPGHAGPRFSPNIGNPSNTGMFFNQPGPGRGMPPPMYGPALNGIVPAGRGQPHDKSPGGWAPSRTSGPPGKAPSRGEQNDYSQNFVDTGMRPQNFIRELELTNVVEDYPKLRELIQKKDEIVAKSSSPPMYFKCDLRDHVLTPEFFGTKFDVILVDPPWEEYVHRAPGVADHTEYWTFEEILNLRIEAIADTPSFIFLWVGDGAGLEQGRQCLKKWGFRRCEDICWVKTNKTNATPGLRHDSHTLFQHSKEHCLMGIKGTVRRSTDGHIIHANIDTDVIIAEEPPYGSTAKPEDMYRIIEHFSLGRRRLELFGGDHNIRSGWLTIGKGLSSSNFNAEAYIRNFSDKEGRVWQGGGGRNPPPESPHLVLTTPDIEALRPKSPMKNQQQMQQSASISITPGNSTNKRATGNSPQNPTSLSLNQEASGSTPSTPVPWASPLEGFKGREGSNFVSDDRVYDMHGYNPAYAVQNSEYMEFESQRVMNMF